MASVAWLLLVASALAGSCTAAVLTHLEIATERRAWEAFMRAVPEDSQHRGRDRGIVVIGGLSHFKADPTNAYTLHALLAIARLREVGCGLPVELWHDGDAALLPEEVGDALRAAGRVVLRNFHDVPEGAAARGYQLTCIALLNSRFEEVLYIDADNLVLSDPTPLFEQPDYKETQAIFWPDFFIASPWATLWEVIGRPPQMLWTLETGQLLVNLRMHWRSLMLALYFNRHGPRFYYKASHGDADIFLFAWLALNASYHVAPPLAVAGDLRQGEEFCGHTILQYQVDQPNEALFAHRSHDTLVEGSGLQWRAIKQFPHWNAPDMVGRGMESEAAWFEMLREGRYAFRHTNNRGIHSVRDLGIGLQILQRPDLSVCRCIDSEVMPCWDVDTPHDVSHETVHTLARLRGMGATLKRLLSQLVVNKTQMRREWHTAWVRHVMQLGRSSGATRAQRVAAERSWAKPQALARGRSGRRRGGGTPSVGMLWKF